MVKILSTELAQYYQIASLQRGHSVFTSFIAKNGRIIFLDSHIERLLKGADFLFPYAGWGLNHEKLKQYIESEFNKMSGEAKNGSYFRLSIFDDCIHLQQRELGNFSDVLTLTTALKVKAPGLLPSFLKLPNYVESDLELAVARDKKFDEVIFFDHVQNVTEASTSNIFIVASDGRILTPPPSSMILDGITRKKLFQKLEENNFPIFEVSISKEDLLKAREIWLTNSVKGLRFVNQFDDLFFEKENSMFVKIVEIFGRHGELA
jgi:branched-chain amino acid aminotransferase